MSEFGLGCGWDTGSGAHSITSWEVRRKRVVAGRELDELTLMIYAAVRCSTDSEANTTVAQTWLLPVPSRDRILD